MEEDFENQMQAAELMYINEKNELESKVSNQTIERDEKILILEEKIACEEKITETLEEKIKEIHNIYSIDIASNKSIIESKSATIKEKDNEIHQCSNDVVKLTLEFDEKINEIKEKDNIIHDLKQIIEDNEGKYRSLTEEFDLFRIENIQNNSEKEASLSIIMARNQQEKDVSYNELQKINDVVVDYQKKLNICEEFLSESREVEFKMRTKNESNINKLQIDLDNKNSSLIDLQLKFVENINNNTKNESILNNKIIDLEIIHSQMKSQHEILVKESDENLTNMNNDMIDLQNKLNDCESNVSLYQLKIKESDIVTNENLNNIADLQKRLDLTKTLFNKSRSDASLCKEESSQKIIELEETITYMGTQNESNTNILQIDLDNKNKSLIDLQLKCDENINNNTKNESILNNKIIDLEIIHSQMKSQHEISLKEFDENLKNMNNDMIDLQNKLNDCEINVSLYQEKNVQLQAEIESTILTLEAKRKSDLFSQEKDMIEETNIISADYEEKIHIVESNLDSAHAEINVCKLETDVVRSEKETILADCILKETELKIELENYKTNYQKDIENFTKELHQKNNSILEIQKHLDITKNLLNITREDATSNMNICKIEAEKDKLDNETLKSDILKLNEDNIAKQTESNKKLISMKNSLVKIKAENSEELKNVEKNLLQNINLVSDLKKKLEISESKFINEAKQKGKEIKDIKESMVIMENKYKEDIIMNEKLLQKKIDIYNDLQKKFDNSESNYAVMKADFEVMKADLTQAKKSLVIKHKLEIEVLQKEIQENILQIHELKNKKIDTNSTPEYIALEEKLQMYILQYDRVNEENSYLLGHTNSKQRIHYVEKLKVEMQTLMDENARLRVQVLYLGSTKSN
jgi:hypothetical protein